MFDLHTHSLISDGELLPSEIAARYTALGFKVIAITDHADYSNIDSCINSILAFTKRWPKNSAIKVLPGIELTHLPLNQFKPLAAYARKKGIKIIIAHGQTLSEPVAKGTNLAALNADIDILAHPGNITLEEARLAKKRRIFLEVTARLNHSKGNKQVVKMSRLTQANLILNTDSHAPRDIISQKKIIANARKSGLTPKEIAQIYLKVSAFLKAISK
jgi:histidinol phosphatase-like PHP family hydrolase